MGWLMTIPQALVALLIVLPIGLFGAWLRRVVMRAYRRDLTGWLALSRGRSSDLRQQRITGRLLAI
jgi:hypothetical protein